MPKTKSRPKAAQPTPAAQAKLRQLYDQAQIAQRMFTSYAEGLMQGLGLEGAWMLDVQNMIFQRKDGKPDGSPTGEN